MDIHFLGLVRKNLLSVMDIFLSVMDIHFCLVLVWFLLSKYIVSLRVVVFQWEMGRVWNFAPNI